MMYLEGPPQLTDRASFRPCPPNCVGPESARIGRTSTVEASRLTASSRAVVRRVGKSLSDRHFLGRIFRLAPGGSWSLIVNNGWAEWPGSILASDNVWGVP